MLKMINDTITEILEKQEGKKFTAKFTVKLTVNQKRIINALKDNPYIIQTELAAIIGISERSIKTNMKKLQQNGIIRRVGADKNGRWEAMDF